MVANTGGIFCSRLNSFSVGYCCCDISPQEPVEEPEDETLRKQDEHYLRELRICIREVGLFCFLSIYLRVGAFTQSYTGGIYGKGKGPRCSIEIRNCSVVVIMIALTFLIS